MENLILSQIPLSELISQVKQAVREEMAANAALYPAASTNERPITQKELCAYLGVTAQTIIRWKKRKRIPFFNIGSAVRFNLIDVKKALENEK